MLKLIKNRISKYQKEIAKIKTSIPKNDKRQEKSQDQISSQEDTVQNFSDKLNMIKEFR